MRFRFLIFVFFIIHSSTLVFSQSNLSKYNEGLAIYKSSSVNGKPTYGFVNHKGKLVIPSDYDTVYSNFQYGLAVVGKNKNAGVIDKKGKVLVPFSFKKIDEINKNVIAVEDHHGLWGFYNHLGEKKNGECI